MNMVILKNILLLFKMLNIALNKLSASDIDFSFKNLIHAVLGMIKLNNISLDFYRSLNNQSTKKLTILQIE